MVWCQEQEMRLWGPNKKKIDCRPVKNEAQRCFTNGAIFCSTKAITFDSRSILENKFDTFIFHFIALCSKNYTDLLQLISFKCCKWYFSTWQVLLFKFTFTSTSTIYKYQFQFCKFSYKLHNKYKEIRKVVLLHILMKVWKILRNFFLKSDLVLSKQSLIVIKKYNVREFGKFLLEKSCRNGSQLLFPPGPGRKEDH